MRTFAIGDIHGCSTALRTLLEIVPLTPEDTVVTLGDYVDRGPDSRGVIDQLLELQKRVKLIPLRGNHEIMMMLAREARSAMSNWRRYGGEAALKSYGPGGLADVPPAHWAFLRSCRPFYEEERQFYVHANAYPDRPLRDQTDVMLYWTHLGDVYEHCSGKQMICGHTAQGSGEPLDLGVAICIDTYAYGGGFLTCLDVEGRVYWQADEKGRTKVAVPLPELEEFEE